MNIFSRLKLILWVSPFPYLFKSIHGKVQFSIECLSACYLWKFAIGSWSPPLLYVFLELFSGGSVISREFSFSLNWFFLLHYIFIIYYWLKILHLSIFIFNIRFWTVYNIPGEFWFSYGFRVRNFLVIAQYRNVSSYWGLLFYKVFTL